MKNRDDIIFCFKHTNSTCSKSDLISSLNFRQKFKPSTLQSSPAPFLSRDSVISQRADYTEIPCQAFFLSHPHFSSAVFRSKKVPFKTTVSFNTINFVISSTQQKSKFHRFFNELFLEIILTLLLLPPYHPSFYQRPSPVCLFLEVVHIYSRGNV